MGETKNSSNIPPHTLYAKSHTPYHLPMAPSLRLPRIRISLADKCQLLFGAAVVLILAAALSVPWLRMQKLVDQGQREIARRLTDAWLADIIQLGGKIRTNVSPTSLEAEPDRPLIMSIFDRASLDFAAAKDPLLNEALQEFTAWPDKIDEFRAVADKQGLPIYRYARAIRQRDLDPNKNDFTATLPPTQVADPLRAIILVEMRQQWAGDQVRLNKLYFALAGLVAGLLAIAAFWFITTRLILSPVRVLRDTAEKVSRGDLNIRSDINTGDEFEQLSDTFNTMLANLKGSQDKLTELNKQLDLKLGELAASNLSLFEANRIKGEFLANVSHELRTPLNSIIGFAEVLTESFPADDPAAEKRRRYIDNILTSGRSLLGMITELLDLAKIEAGRIDLHVDRMSIADTIEVLSTLIRPQADSKKLTVTLNASRQLPVILTDPGKFQQIIFNFLSNAVKFTPEGGQIEIGAVALGDPEPTAIRAFVKDTGPGIPVEKHAEIFEKFKQLDAGHTKSFGGTGLGLAISKELARMLEGRIEVDSDLGRGAIFSLILPLAISQKSEPLMPDLVN